jgi:regulator of nonsense transcripts 3
MSSRNTRKEAAPATKVVMRCLPPTLQREAFLEQVSPLPDHDYFYLAPADNSLGSFAHATVYINFLRIDDVITFKEKFDGYVFLDTKGNEYTAVVEFAPYQKVPKKKSKRVDEKKGTIENDSDFKKFLEIFQTETKVANVDMAVVLEEIENREKELKASVNQKGSTPLLEFLKKRREERILALQKSKDEKRKKELERKQREEELRALRKRNESAKLRQQQQEKKHAEERQATARSTKAADADYKPSSAGSKSVSKRSAYNDEYYEQEKGSVSSSSKRGDAEKVKPEKAEYGEKKSQDKSQKSETERPQKTKPPSSKSESSYSSKGGDKGGNYYSKEEKPSGSRRHKEVAYDEYGYDYEYDPNYDYDYRDYRSYGPSHSHSDRSYDSSYYGSSRRSQEWSSGRPDYYRPSSKSGSSSSKHHPSDKEKKGGGAPPKQQDSHGQENVKSEDRLEASSSKEPATPKNPAKSSEKPPRDERRDYAHGQDYEDHRPARNSEQRSAADRERDRQQKVRYRDRPEKEIYVPGKRMAERRKQTSASDKGGGDEDATSSHVNDASYDNAQ